MAGLTLAEKSMASALVQASPGLMTAAILTYLASALFSPSFVPSSILQLTELAKMCRSSSSTLLKFDGGLHITAPQPKLLIWALDSSSFPDLSLPVSFLSC